MDISIIIPVKDEEKTITKILKVIHKKIKSSHEVLIVYDDLFDQTPVVVKKYAKEDKITNIFLIKNSVGNKKGVVNAIKTGINHAKGKAVVTTMGDLSDDVTQIDDMFDQIKKGYDLVAASRYMPGGTKVGGPLFKTFLSRAAGLSLHWLFKLPTHDATNAYKMYRRNIFKNITIESTGGFEYSLEITIKAYKLGYKITEIPTTWHDNLQGKSHFRLFHWLPKYIKTYFFILSKGKNKKIK